MGLIVGGLNGRRFRIATPLPEGFRDLFLEQVRANAFVDCDNANDPEPRVGWVDVFDPGNVTFELNTFLYDRYLAVSLRSDTKKIQGTYLKIAAQKKFAEICAERGLEKLTKAEQEVVQEALEAELYRRALPSVATTDLVWDIHTGEVTVFATSETVLEQIRQLTKETFGVVLEPEGLTDWLTDKLKLEEVVQRLGVTLPGGLEGGADPLDGKQQALASDFLTWLWVQSESSDGRFRVVERVGGDAAASTGDDDDDAGEPEVTESLRNADLTLWIDSRLKLRELKDEDPATTILLGASPSTTPEARQNLHLGKRPVEAQLGLKLGDLEISLALQASTEGPVISGLKIPFAVKSGKEERLFERVVLLDLVHTTVRKLFQQFFLDRTSPVWEPRVEQFANEGLVAEAK